MSWLNHKELRIVKGVNAQPGDTNTAEPQLTVINLLDNTSGISLAGVDGWSPKIPSIENSGIWSDSPLSPGRQLLSATEGNVTETMKVIITGSSVNAMIKTLDSLYLMANDARAFWTDNSQIEPVYLHWWASCSTTWIGGRQYSRIYNMTIDPVFGDSPTPTITATLVIEREPYWQWIPPGAPPTQWKYEFYAQNATMANMDVLTAANCLLSVAGNTTFFNRSEYANANLTAMLTDNAITIPANLIPGDAPALMMLRFGNNLNVIVGKRSLKVPTLDPSTQAVIPQTNIINGNSNGATLGLNATLVADTGASKTPAGVQDRVEVSFATVANNMRWNSGPTNHEFNGNRYIGRFMVFMRCRQVAGTQGDITMYLRFGSLIANDSDGVKLNVVNPTLIGSAGNTASWGLTYMGTITLPIRPQKATINEGKAAGSGGGAGLDNQASGGTPEVALFASRTGVAALLYFNDLIFIPIDEGSITLESGDSALGTPLYDNTGFFTHGLPDDYATISTPATNLEQLCKFTGTGITLTPNVENKLYCILYDASNQSNSQVTTSTVILNIIPRSRGIRDVVNING